LNLQAAIVSISNVFSDELFDAMFIGFVLGPLPAVTVQPADGGGTPSYVEMLQAASIGELGKA
jgi:hypothetical protein